MCKNSAQARYHPEPWNIYHIYLPIGECAETCNRHTLESMGVFDKAEKERWPSTINFAVLHKRIQMLKPELLRVCADPTESLFWEEVKKIYDGCGRAALGYMNIGRQNPDLFMNG